jgi:hypothetical protein
MLIYLLQNLCLFSHELWMGLVLRTVNFNRPAQMNIFGLRMEIGKHPKIHHERQRESHGYNLYFQLNLSYFTPFND